MNRITKYNENYGLFSLKKEYENKDKSYLINYIGVLENIVEKIDRKLYSINNELYTIKTLIEEEI